MMEPLKYETMMIVPLLQSKRLRLYGRDLVYNIQVCWAVKYHAENSPFKACDYDFSTLGLDGVI